MLEICLSQVSSVFLKPGEGTPLSVVMNWVQDRVATQGGVGTSSPSQLPVRGLRASLSTHTSLCLQLSKKGGVGSKPRRLLSPKQKIYSFSS